MGELFAPVECGGNMQSKIDLPGIDLPGISFTGARS